MPPPTAPRGIDSRKTKDQLIAELEDLRGRVPVDSNAPTPQLGLDEWFQQKGGELRLLTDALPVLISYLDPELIYRYANLAYEKWFGHPRDWVVGRDVREVLGEAAYEAVRGYLEIALSGETVTYEETVPYRTGGVRHTRSSFVPHLDQDGKVVGIFVSVTDISDRKKAEDALRESNELLESRVEERTTELRRANEALKTQIAERERTEAELREKENLLNTIFDELPGPLAVKDKESRYVKINKAWKNIFNLDEKESLGKTAEQISSFTPEQGKEISRVDRAVIEGNHVVIKSLRHLRDRLGNERIFDVRNAPIEDEKGKPIGVISFGLEITESWKAELARKESEEKLRAVVDHSPSAIILKDLEGRYLLVNRRFEEMKGLPAEAFIGKTVYDSLPKKYADLIAKQEKKVLETGKTDIREIERPNPDHSTLSLISTKFPVRDSDGQIIGIGTISTDITARKKAEKALSASEAQFQELVEGSIQGILVHRDGKPLFANQACADIFGYPNPDAILNLDDVFQFVAPEDRQRVVSISRARIDGKEAPTHYDFKGIKKDGTHVWIDNIARVVSWKGEPAVQSTYFDITERKLAVEKLRESEELFRATVENSPIIFFLKDIQGRFLLVNRLFEKWEGIPAEKMIGKTSAEIFPEKFSHQFDSQDKEVSKTGRPVSREMDVPSVNGIRRIVCTKFPVKNSAGISIAIGSIVSDITDRRKAEQELRSSQRLLETVFDTIPHSLYVRDADSKFLMVNQAHSRRFNATPESVIGMHILDLPYGTKEDRQRFLENDRKVMESGERIENFEFSATHSDGTLRHYRNIQMPLSDEKGNVVGVVGLAEDITERTLAENNLLKSHDQLRTITDNLPVLILHIDKDERYLFLNKTAELWFDTPPGALIGTTIGENLGQSEYEKLAPFIRKVLSGQEVRFEPQLKYADGTERTIDLLFIPDREPGGAVKGYFALGRDITEVKGLEDKLRQSQKMEALGTLTGGIAHDFNNILAPILGFSEILLERANPSSRDYNSLKSIFRSAIRAKDLVSQIMLFSRPGETTKVNCDLRTVAREIVGLLHSTFPKSISIQADISREPGIVFCDPTQVYQVLLNLCVNAEKALGETGEVTISLGAAELDGTPDFMGNILSGKFVRLAVSDNGIGMGADILPHIFDPFFTRREVGEGTGLGLSTVFGIVKSHNGGIVVESQPGRGSTFEIFFPRVEEVPEQFMDSPDAVPTGDETILMVDDEEEIVILAKEILEGKGYRVMTFSDPIEALEAFQADPGHFDLVLTDQSMPKMKGEWLVRDIRKIDTEIPIILCTGYSRTISPENGAAIGINKFLYKPVRPNDLCRVVREVLDAALKTFN